MKNISFLSRYCHLLLMLLGFMSLVGQTYANQDSQWRSHQVPVNAIDEHNPVWDQICYSDSERGHQVKGTDTVANTKELLRYIRDAINTQAAKPSIDRCACTQVQAIRATEIQEDVTQCLGGGGHCGDSKLAQMIAQNNGNAGVNLECPAWEASGALGVWSGAGNNYFKHLGNEKILVSQAFCTTLFNYIYSGNHNFAANGFSGHLGPFVNKQYYGVDFTDRRHMSNPPHNEQGVFLWTDNCPHGTSEPDLHSLDTNNTYGRPAGYLRDNYIYRIQSVKSGQVLDITGDQHHDGSNAHQWGVHPGANQLFEAIGHGDGWFTLRALHSGKCLDGGAGSQNHNLYQWSCHMGNNQRFKSIQRTDGTVLLQINHGRTCMDQEGHMHSGGNVKLWGCDVNNENQIFRLYVAKTPIKDLVAPFDNLIDFPFHIQSVKSGMFLDVDSLQSNGANLRQWTFHGGDNQTFTAENHENGWYTFDSTHSGRCIDGGDGSLNHNLYQWDCHMSENQQFKILPQDSGSVLLQMNLGEKCMDQEGHALPGGNVKLWGCNQNNANQLFRLYHNFGS